MRAAMLVLTIMAFLWCAVPLLMTHQSLLWLLLPALVSAGLLARGWRLPRRPGAAGDGRRIGRVIGLWSTVEVAAILAIGPVLDMAGAPVSVLTPAVVIIVGLHFIPLAHGIPARIYYGTAAALIVVGLVALLTPAAVRPFLASFGAALALWGTALNIILRRGR